VSFPDKDAPAIYLFGGQGIFIPYALVDGDPNYDPNITGTYPVVSTTIRYVPLTIHNKHKLNDGEIAGIVIAVVVGVGGIIFLLLSYLAYRNRGVRQILYDDEPTSCDLCLVCLYSRNSPSFNIPF
jgi:hypothetical protein